MRQIRYGVAMSLDGYIASADGGYDWIVMDKEIDFGAIFNRFDTLIMGRKTYQGMAGGGGGGSASHTTYVVSTTLDQAAHPSVTVIADRVAERVAEIRAQPGKDIWLFGGGTLFQTLLDAHLVDAIDAAIIPVILGAGVPFLPAAQSHVSLELRGHRLYGTSGIMALDYAVLPPKKGRKKTS